MPTLAKLLLALITNLPLFAEEKREVEPQILGLVRQVREANVNDRLILPR